MLLAAFLVKSRKIAVFIQYSKWVVEAYGKFQKDLVGETKVGGKVQYQASIFNGLYTQKTDSKVRSDVKAREVLPAYRWVLSGVVTRKHTSVSDIIDCR